MISARILILPLALLGATSIAQYPGAKSPPARFSTGFRSIQEPDAIATLRYLAGPDFVGRRTGQPGYLLAAGYVAARLRSMGIEPAGERGSYFQPVNADSVSVDPKDAKAILPDNQSLAFGTDISWSTHHELDTDFPIAFARFSKDGTAPSLEGLDGHVVVVYPVPPTEFRQSTIAFQADARRRNILLVYPNIRLNIPQPMTQIRENIPTEVRPISLSLTTSAAARMGELVGLPSDLSPSDNPGLWKAPFNLRLQNKLVRVPSWTSVNVLGKITGTDKRLRDEVVLIGSHLDHMGIQEQGILYGADDNASGVTANLLIAQAFAKNPLKPKRTVAFCFWTAEEMGLLGSARYVRNPLVAPDKMVAYLNMDMVGRNSGYRPWNDDPADNQDAAYVSAAKITSPDLHKVLLEANKAINLNLREDKEERSRRSDTGSFIAVNVPTLKAFTGEHEDYHRAGDTPDKINFRKLVSVAKWLYLSAQELAHADGRPAYLPGRDLLTGTLAIETPLMLLPTDTVELRLMDGDKVIDEQSMARPGQFPVQFGLVCEPGKAKADQKFRIEAVVLRNRKPILVGQAETGISPLPRTRVRITLAPPKR